MTRDWAGNHGNPAVAFVAVTPSNSADLPKGVTRALFVGTAGDVKVRSDTGEEVTIKSAASQYHPLRVARVLATGTTATDIVALY